MPIAMPACRHTIRMVAQGGPDLSPGLKVDSDRDASVIMSCGLDVPRNAITASRVSPFR